jgi:REP element-mobilizing transposase RayT
MTRQVVSRGSPDNLPTRGYTVHPKEPDVYLPVRRDWRRLAGIDYRDPDCVCLVTICTRDRAPVFGWPPAAEITRQLTEERPRRFRYSLLAYTILPDHVHMILAPGMSGLSIGQIVGRWKSHVASYLWPLGFTGTPWQRDYDDRVLRTACRGETGGVAKMVEYVLENPVRRGLVKRWEDYPYSGCWVDLG